MLFDHKSVLLDECIDGIHIKEDGIYVDGTTGGAGHSYFIAEKLTTGKLFCFDKDPDALSVAKKRLEKFDCVTFIQDDFVNMKDALLQKKIFSVDGILLDLGVSSYQLDTVDRGFSYNKDSFLDMRMSKSGKSAYDVVNNYDEFSLGNILKIYGEEAFFKSISRNIVKERQNKPIETTLQLVDIIKASLPQKVKRKEKNPSRKTFQAIRIEVNNEIESLKNILEDGSELLNKEGRFCIITFHSIEDRIVKHFFSHLSVSCICPPDFPICVCGKTQRFMVINKKPIIASENELENNKRSRSAKLRILKKL
ncbi:MAG: 16S rRNA (cytosine(1402)-N(4))-methyltransferase RsmH [Oscillospiraceae bacterium]